MHLAASCCRKFVGPHLSELVDGCHGQGPNAVECHPHELVPVVDPSREVSHVHHDITCIVIKTGKKSESATEEPRQ